MNHVDLFAGIGGFSYAVDHVWENVEHEFVEVDTFCQKVLRKHWPNAKIHSDIRDYHPETVDLVTGGFPCQPYSQAGMRRGSADDRALWPEMARVIEECRPTWIIAENVAGIEHLFEYEVFSELEGKIYSTPEEAKADLDGIRERIGTNSLYLVVENLGKLGYEVQTLVIPACAVNAPHRRDRVWIVAHTQSAGTRSEDRKVANKGGRVGESRREDLRQTHGQIGASGTNTADTNASNSSIINDGRYNGITQSGQGEEFGNGVIAGDDRDTEIAGRTGGGQRQRKEQYGRTSAGSDQWSEHWLEAATRLCRVDDGLPRQLYRRKRIAVLGNAIVPQIAIEILKAIRDC